MESEGRGNDGTMIGRRIAHSAPLLLMPVLLLAALLPGAAARAETLPVVASIPPLHGLVAAVMEGAGAPRLLMRSGSPHGYQLRPSEARVLGAARLVFLIDPRFEGFLARPVAALPPGRAVIASRAAGIRLLAAREGGAWDAHDHDHDHDHAHGKEAPAARTDFHLWLSPHNARAIAAQAAAALAAADPANAARFAANARALTARIDAQEAALGAKLRPLRGVPYIVFHDAYHYFEDAFGLNPAGAVTVAPDRKPGIRRLRAIRTALARSKARCVFAEPQFPPALIRTILDGAEARAGALDPIGAAIRPGPAAWFAVMDGLADALHGCLAPVR
jgi:zinc transport system substrate-binding protein